MSSLAASRADGYYYPPEYDPAQHGSLNQFRGQHPLRERANKLDQGILVIRFEMPFNVWCAGCNHLIGKGVRFNAEKKQVGNYYSTRIWSFSMRAPCCGQKIEVQTDPKNTEYVVVSGAKRKVETWTAQSAETIELPEQEEQAFVPRVDDTMARLEKGEVDKIRAKELNGRVAELYYDSKLKYKDDYDLNKQLRRQNRHQRKHEQELDKKRKSLGLSDNVRLLPASDEDKFAASIVQYGDPQSFDKKWQQKRKAIKAQSIFSPSALTKPLKHAALGSRSADTIPAEIPADSDSDVDRMSFEEEQPNPSSLNRDSGSGASSQTDEEQFNGSASQQAHQGARLSEREQKINSEEQYWVLPSANSMGSAKGYKSELAPISEDVEMDCAKLERGGLGKKTLCPFVNMANMKKTDKAKCRMQLSCKGGQLSNKNLAVAQCQQKLKKTSIADKIAAALKRR